MKITVVIVHYGDLQTTRECLASLYTHENVPFSVIVVNNMPQRFYPKDFSTRKKIHVINTKKNLGFAGGVNIGIRQALKDKSDAVCLLNNDTHIRKPFVRKLMDELVISSVGIVAPAIRFKKNKKTLFDIGGKVNPIFGRTSHTEVEKLIDKIPREVTYVSGCCMLLKKQVCKKIGYFDDSFFLYYEDVDFCLRAKKGGFQTIVTPSVWIDHELSKSAGKLSQVAVYNLTKSSILFGKKYFSTGIKKYTHNLFVLYQTFVFTVKSKYGFDAWKALIVS